MNYNNKNSGSFKKGQTPWNKGIKKDLDINFIKEEYLKNKKSTVEIAKELKVSNSTVATRLKENGIKLRTRLSKEHKKKISDTLKSKGIKPKQRYSGEPWNKGKKGVQVPWNKGLVGVQISKKKGKNFKELYGDREKEIKSKIVIARSKQVTPVKDSSIELKLQKFLDELNIEYEKHKYMYISHAYQCDIFVPSLNLVLEADGLFWHNYPLGRDIDKLRTRELKELGYSVIRLWEQDINKMNLEDFKRLLDNVQAI